MGENSKTFSKYVHYYPTKFEIKIQLMYGETKKKINCIRGQNKLNSIVYGVN